MQSSWLLRHSESDMRLTSSYRASSRIRDGGVAGSSVWRKVVRAPASCSFRIPMICTSANLAAPCPLAGRHNGNLLERSGALLQSRKGVAMRVAGSGAGRCVGSRDSLAFAAQCNLDLSMPGSPAYQHFLLSIRRQAQWLLL